MNKKMTPLKAIKEKCLNCSGWERRSVKNCEHTDCPLYFFRFGKNPHMQRPEYPEGQRFKKHGAKSQKAGQSNIKVVTI